MKNDIKIDSSCMDDFDQDSITTDVALEKILNSIIPTEKTETIPIRESLNRILAKDIKSDIW